MKRKIFSFILLLFFVTVSLSAQHQEIIISKSIKLVRLSNNIYLHITSLHTQNWGKVEANGLIFIENGKALMIDTPWNDDQTEVLYKWLQDSLNATVTTVIPTHWHDDCMGGLGYLKSKGVTTYANQKTIDIAKIKGLPVPELGFSDSLKIKFESISVDCYYLGGGHTIDVIAVWLPTEKILFAGDISKELNSSNLGNIEDADLESWPSILKEILVMFPDARVVIPGHGAIGGLELIHHTLTLLQK